ncbi:MAG: hypothetical protein CMQ92_02275 [Gammaproteobacteria bacterium]|jgi:hypothetical protein|nr:hypothetical protein [Gammaproteobacteria bacterium]|tara:strand:- start:374 stop:862 length:489 start_codon:yes stop_codon:yes gene_type:complete
MDFDYWIELINKVVNIITGPAVIFSVWFLVAQIQTQIKVGKAASRQSIAEAHQEVTLAGLDPLLMRAKLKLIKKEELSIDEEVGLRIHMTAILRARENHFYQHKMGMLDDEEWKTMRKALGTLFIDNKLNLDIWNKSKSTFNPAFAEIVDEEIQLRKDTFRK